MIQFVNQEGIWNISGPEDVGKNWSPRDTFHRVYSRNGDLGTTFSLLFLPRPGERVGTMQLGSPGGQGLPCRLPGRLYPSRI